MIGVDGAIDIHVHAGPELFPRIGDGIDIATRARDMGMAGLVFKAHHEQTASRAAYAMRAVEGIDLWGGIVLNGFVGGINPVAVSAALSVGAKFVWMPTIHARQHVATLGAGTYGISSMTLSESATLHEGITVLDDEGRLTAAAAEVIRLVAEADAAIATGHLAPEEIHAVAAEASRVGARCVVTHAFFPDHSADLLHEVAALGAWIEISAVVAYPMCRHFGHSMTLADAKQLIEDVGAQRIVVSTDAGQVHNPWPPEVLRAFVNALVAVGVNADDVRSMVVDRPREILGLA